RWIFCDLLRDQGIRHGEFQFCGLLLQRTIAQHLAQDLPVKTQFSSALSRDRLSRLARDPAQLLLESSAKIFRGVLKIANRRQHVRAIASENVVDAPNAE